jgi:hypothetical protein
MERAQSERKMAVAGVETRRKLTGSPAGQQSRQACPDRLTLAYSAPMDATGQTLIPLEAESDEMPRCCVRGNCTTLADITTRLRQGRFPLAPVCHPEHVEGSLSFPVPIHLHPSSFISHHFPSGWLVSANLNNVLMKTIIKLPIEVTGLTFDKDVIVEF